MIKADGTDDYMIVTPITLSQPFTAFSVQVPITSARVLCFVSSDASRALFTPINTLGNTRLSVHQGTALVTTSDIPFGQPVIGSSILSGASSSIRINGGFKADGNAGTDGGTRVALYTIHPGAAWYDGHGGDIIIYTGALSETDIRRIEEYLSWKYAIELEPI